MGGDYLSVGKFLLDYQGLNEWLKIPDSRLFIIVIADDKLSYLTLVSSVSLLPVLSFQVNLTASPEAPANLNEI